jgi:hypothetical protein
MTPIGDPSAYLIGLGVEEFCFENECDIHIAQNSLTQLQP